MRRLSYIAGISLSTMAPSAFGTTAVAQEVLFETAADLPALVSPDATREDRPLRFGMHGTIEHKSRIFWLGLGVAALASPDALYVAAERVALRTSFGLRLRSVTVGPPEMVAERVAVVQPAIMGEVGSHLSFLLADGIHLYGRWALRAGGDATRIPPEEIGRDEHAHAPGVSAFIVSPHLAVGATAGPFQIGIELDAYEVVDEGGPSAYAQVLEGRAFVGAFSIFRLSRQVYTYFRALPFEGLPFEYTWGLSVVLNPYDP